MRDTVKIGFSIVVLFVTTVPLLSLNLIDYTAKPPIVADMEGNTFISYPFDIIVGRKTPFLKDTSDIFYSNRIEGLITNSEGDNVPVERSYNDTIISRLLYMKSYDAQGFGAYLMHNYHNDISGKTAFTSYNKDSLNNYIFYQNVKWSNDKFPLLLSFSGNYNADSFHYNLRLTGYNRNQFIDIGYLDRQLTIKFANSVNRFRTEGFLDLRNRQSKIAVSTYIDKTVFNESDISAAYDPYNTIFYVGLSHNLRIDSRNIVKGGLEYYFKEFPHIYIGYYGIKPYIYGSVNYYPTDSLKFSVVSILDRRYVKGYIKGGITYDSTVTYTIDSYASLIYEPKDALIVGPGVKIKGENENIEVIPVMEIKFIDLSIYASYNLYWKRLVIAGKWDFYN